MQNNKGSRKPAGELPGYKEVFQDAIDAVEQEAMQKMIEIEHSFSESQFDRAHDHRISWSV